MSALVCTLVLAASNASFWVEREQTTLRVTADLRSLFDQQLRRRLTSGLTTTLFLDVQVQAIDDDSTVGAVRRLVRVRWDLWGETLQVHHDLPASESTRHPSVAAFLADFAQLRAAPIATEVPADPAVYRVTTRLEVNPLSGEQLARMRRWLLDTGGFWSLDPLGSGLLGSFVRLFHNLTPGVAERVLRAEGPPFRGDRLPFHR